MNKKTLAIHQLEEASISFDLLSYVIDENDLSAPTLAQKIGLEAAQVFKTLLMRTDKKEVILACLPGDASIDLKALARLRGDKNIHLVALKEIKPLTGYIRGGVSPLGLKKEHAIYFDELAFVYDKISISAGIRGLQVLLNPKDLQITTQAITASISRYAP